MCRELLLQLDALLFRFGEIKGVVPPDAASLLGEEYVEKVGAVLAVRVDSICD